MGLLERRNSAYQEGPGGLRRTILVQLWAPYLDIMRKCCCTGIRECQAAVFAFEDFLRLLIDQNDFGPRFKHICHSMQVTHGLKLALVDYMAKLVPHRGLGKGFHLDFNIKFSRSSRFVNFFFARSKQV